MQYQGKKANKGRKPVCRWFLIALLRSTEILELIRKVSKTPLYLTLSRSLNYLCINNMQLLLTCLTPVPKKSWWTNTLESIDKISACSVITTRVAVALVYFYQRSEYLIN